MNIINRSPMNPLIQPKDISPLFPGGVVLGIFNAGVVKIGGETLLLCRVAEGVAKSDAVYTFQLSQKSDYREIVCQRFGRKEDYDLSDTRIVKNKRDGRVESLTSLSYFRLARSCDGSNFTFDKKDIILPRGQEESWGIEDPRITLIDGLFHIIYAGVSSNGVVPSRIVTKDFKTFERKSILLPPSNKDCLLLPEKIKGRYVLLHRPIPHEIGGLNIWLAYSPDLIHWGDHTLLYKAGTAGQWDETRVGAGPPPILTEKGWLLFFHGGDEENRYSMGALLLERENPAHIIARSSLPLMTPREEYEKNGFFSQVVFPCGLVREDNRVTLYYGAADNCLCRGDFSLNDVWSMLNV